MHLGYQRARMSRGQPETAGGGRAGAWWDGTLVEFVAERNAGYRGTPATEERRLPRNAGYRGTPATEERRLTGGVGASGRIGVDPGAAIRSVAARSGAKGPPPAVGGACRQTGSPMATRGTGARIRRKVIDRMIA
ncbi:hypothetical protein Sar04_29980 [Salinispora arenicola]|uniref:Uncharacterized protein n=1 Tax=Salinispora arenicola TaxID=168697 RepID=A0ABQ4JTH1_SALAC|nr:hypothetical protein Sar04_29980 [Salinispora arenicola]